MQRLVFLGTSRGRVKSVLNKSLSLSCCPYFQVLLSSMSVIGSGVFYFDVAWCCKGTAKPE